MKRTLLRQDASGKGASQGFKVSFPAMITRYTEEEIEAVVRVMRHGRSMTQGEEQSGFEEEFRRFTGAAHAFAVSSGTAALRLAAQLCRLGPGDEVILPAYTFCATAIPFAATGAKLVWADIDPQRWTLSPEDVERKITSRTRAVVAVHLLGMPADMEAILALAGRHGLRVVEDCAQAPGALSQGRRVGSLGDFGCFSFNGAKNMTLLGEGGMLTVREEADAALVPGLRHNGVRPYPPDRPRYWIPAMSDVELDLAGVWPLKFCIGEAQCALGRLLLQRLDQINGALFQQAVHMRAALAGCPELSFQQSGPGDRPVFHALVARLDGSLWGRSREDFMDRMTQRHGIRLICQYYPLYRYPLFRKMGFGEADCPRLERHWPGSFSYPWWEGVPLETLEYMIEATLETVEELRG